MKNWQTEMEKLTPEQLQALIVLLEARERDDRQAMEQICVKLDTEAAAAILSVLRAAERRTGA